MKGTALITGGAKRIGKAVALGLADMGFNIALHYGHSLKEAESTASEIEAKGRVCNLFHCDLNRTGDVIRLMSRVFKASPDCSLLVNNASVFERIKFRDTEPDSLDRHLNINLKAPFFLSREFARLCRNGQIINILDTRISKEAVNYFAYALSKKALYEFTRMAAKELAPGIRVNGICPGMILASRGMSESDFKKLSRRIPLGRSGSAGDIVSAVRFLVENTFITGDCIYVDGGEQLH